jgi:MFS family permease
MKMQGGSRWQSVSRTLAGFLVAPIFPALLVAILSIFSGKFGLGVWWIGLAAVIGYPVAIVIGIPLFFFLRWRGLNALWVYILAGAVLGIVVNLVFLPPVTHLNGALELDYVKLYTAPKWLLLGMIVCTIVTICFWLIARPDKHGRSLE